MSLTPGPWTYEYDNDTGPDDDWFVEWYGMPGVFKADREEDARLIAAAPELLEVAIKAESIMRGLSTAAFGSPTSARIADEFLAVIARATEQPA